MNTIDSQFKKISGQLRLAPEERARGREALRSYMAEHPLGEERTAGATFIHLVALAMRRPLPAALILFLFLGSGVSYAAEGAVPGSPLYGVKTGVNEEVRTALAFSSSAKAQWEARLAERRLEEAEKLSARGALSADVAESLAARFEAHAEAAGKYVARVENDDRDEALAVSADIEVVLGAHESILRELALREKENVSESINILALKVKVKAAEAAKVASPAIPSAPSIVSLKVRSDVATESARILPAEEKGKGEDRASVSTEASRQMERKARAALADATEYLERERIELEAHVFSDARARIEEAEETYENGVVSAEAGDFTRAFFSFKNSYIKTREVKKLLQASFDLNIRILPRDFPAESGGEADVRSEENVQSSSESWKKPAEKLGVLARAAFEKAQEALRGSAEENEAVVKARLALRVAAASYEEGERLYVAERYVDAYAAFKEAHGAAVDSHTILRGDVSPRVVPRRFLLRAMRGTRAMKRDKKEKGKDLSMLTSRVCALKLCKRDVHSARLTACALFLIMKNVWAQQSLRSSLALPSKKGRVVVV